MRNPFANGITLTKEDVVNMLGQKQAELVITQNQLQHALAIIEQLRAEAAKTATVA